MIGDFEDTDISVTVERQIKANRRVDISVEIKPREPRDKEPFCLAIENKPYAADQPNQVKDYLDYLKERYQDRALLIYLSRSGDAPSEDSIKASELSPGWIRIKR